MAFSTFVGFSIRLLNGIILTVVPINYFVLVSCRKAPNSSLSQLFEMPHCMREAGSGHDCVDQEVSCLSTDPQAFKPQRLYCHS